MITQNKKGSNRMEPNKITPDYKKCKEQKYLNISVDFVESYAGMVEWSTQSDDSRYHLGCDTRDSARVIDDLTILSTTKSLRVRAPTAGVINSNKGINQNIKRM